MLQVSQFFVTEFMAECKEFPLLYGRATLEPKGSKSTTWKDTSFVCLAYGLIVSDEQIDLEPFVSELANL